ncbi:hypothetical protein MMC17_006501 [Xylographa soralifera]|nr:hypothetical protein [Xylographa soralifera]
MPRSEALNLDYIDEESIIDGKPFVATLLYGPNRPALLLEQIDSLLTSIDCTNAGISLGFSSRDHAEQARDAWNMPEIIVITSHKGCNNDGRRVPYLVSEISFDMGRNLAMLSAKGVSWAKASNTLEVDFSYRESHHGLDLESYSPSASLIAKRQTTQDLSFSILNTNIFAINDMLSPTTTLSFTQKCVACVGTGTVTLAAGNITLISGVESILDSLINPTVSDLASSADISIVFNNFTAEFEFETSIQLTQSFSFHILGEDGIGIPGFSIPGLFTIGPNFNPVIVAMIQLFQPVSFTYGFNFSVPDGSGFQIDMVNLANSQSMGFDSTAFTALPFTLLNFTPGVNVSIAFRPVIALGVNVLDIDLDPVTVFADIPKYVVGLVPLANVDDNCLPLAVNGTGNGEHVRLSSDFVLDLGVGAMAQITDTIAFMPSIPLLTTTLFPMSTCIGPFGAGTANTTIATAPSTNMTKI